VDHPKKHDDVLLKDLSALIREQVNDLDDAARRITQKPVVARLRNLQSTAYGIDAPVVLRRAPLEHYMLEWKELVRGKRGFLDKRAVRFLCWVPEVAVDVRFLAVVQSSGIELNRRTLAGLVRSCHCMWESMPRISPSVEAVRGLLLRYRGSDRVLDRWQAHTEALLASDGPRVMADKLVRSGRSLPSFIDKWRIEPQSAFFRRVVEIATAACRSRLDRLNGHPLVLFYRDLLPWPGWKPSAFKKEIGALILHNPMDDRSREAVQRFILHFEGLGDPRLAANRVKWAEVDHRATDRLIHWLSQENPYAFSEHVYQQGKGWVWKQKTSPWDPLSFEEAEEESMDDGRPSLRD
jgi:hypothetical protein